MSYPQPCLIGEKYTKRNFFQSAWFPCVALILILCGMLMFSGCGATSAPAATSNPSTANTTPLVIAATLPPAAVGASYDGSVTVTGGTAPYSFAVASGQLPQGVALGAATGSVAGTPSASGSFNFAVSVTDVKGLSKQQPLQMTVASATTSTPPTTSSTQSGNSFSGVQHSGGWGQYGQGPPNFVDCSPSPCEGISFWMAQGIQSPSLSGQAAEFNVGGSAPYSDALWNNHLIGPGSSQGMPDSNQTQVPSFHNFTYDVYFYGDNLGLAQAVEFDINQFFNNTGFIWGHECRVAGGNEWDVWDNQKAHWTPTGIPCYPNSNAWNHLTIKVQRNSNNQLVYQSITLNGVTNNLNWTFPPGSAPGWYGITVNYQMDGNYKQDPYNVYLDNLTFSYQ